MNIHVHINVLYSIPTENVFFKILRLRFICSKSRNTPMILFLKKKAFMFQLLFLYEFFLMFFCLFKNRKCQFFNIPKNNGNSYYEYNEHKTNVISVFYFKKNWNDFSTGFPILWMHIIVQQNVYVRSHKFVQFSFAYFCTSVFGKKGARVVLYIDRILFLIY